MSKQNKNAGKNSKKSDNMVMEGIFPDTLNLVSSNEATGMIPASPSDKDAQDNVTQLFSNEPPKKKK